MKIYQRYTHHKKPRNKKTKKKQDKKTKRKSKTQHVYICEKHTAQSNLGKIR